MTHRKLIEQMLGALDDIYAHGHTNLPVKSIITTAREYLAASEQSEHVGEITETNSTGFKCEFSRSLSVGTKLYTAAPQPTTTEPVNQMLLDALKRAVRETPKRYPAHRHSEGYRVAEYPAWVVTANNAIAAAEQAPQPTELTDSDIEELTGRLRAEKEYENWTGREQLVVTGCIDFARAVLAAQKAKT
mgnify:CR=1 FL=1